jgi:hypothetical protein
MSSSLPNSPAFAPMPERSRSRLSNGSWRLQNVDMRSSIGRRYRDLCSAFAAELGGGELSVLDKELVETAAGLALRGALIRAAIALGEETEDDMVRISSELRRVQGLIAAKADRRKPQGSELDEYLAQNYPADDVAFDETATVEPEHIP